jgi:predicted cobalt transporter CbtA
MILNGGITTWRFTPLWQLSGCAIVILMPFVAQAWKMSVVP